MPDAVRRGRDTRDPGAYDGNLRPPKVLVRFRRPRRQDYIYRPLPDLVQEKEWVE